MPPHVRACIVYTEEPREFGSQHPHSTQLRAPGQWRELVPPFHSSHVGHLICTNPLFSSVQWTQPAFGLAVQTSGRANLCRLSWVRFRFPSFPFPSSNSVASALAPASSLAPGLVQVIGYPFPYVLHTWPRRSERRSVVSVKFI